MRGDAVKSALVWAGLAAAIPCVLLATAPAGSGGVGAAAEDDAPGHDAENCRPCRLIRDGRARPLPPEIDGVNVRAEPPAPEGGDQPAPPPGGAGTTR